MMFTFYFDLCFLGGPRHFERRTILSTRCSITTDMSGVRPQPALGYPRIILVLAVTVHQGRSSLLPRFVTARRTLFARKRLPKILGRKTSIICGQLPSRFVRRCRILRWSFYALRSTCLPYLSTFLAPLFLRVGSVLEYTFDFLQRFL